MKRALRGKWWRITFVLLPLTATCVIALLSGGMPSASLASYGGGGGCATCGTGIDATRYGINNDLLYIANGRASNVAVLDVASMQFVDYLPVPYPATNAAAILGQTDATLNKTLGGLGLSAPVSIPDMFYWEVHGVVPSKDRSSIYAVGALSMTPSDWTMYQVNARTHENTRQIPLATSPVGYCGLEYDRNDENSNTLLAESMETGPADLAALFGSPLQLNQPLGGVLPSLGLGSLATQLESRLAPAGAVGGISEEDIASGTNTGFIATDYNGNANSSTCGIAWNAQGDRAFASQMFEPLIDTINWNTKTVDGEILPPNNGMSTMQHQSTSAKSRDLLFTANGSDGVAVYGMSINALLSRININNLVGRGVVVHGVEIAPNNDNVLYVLGEGEPTGIYVVDVSDINAPKLIGGLENGLDIKACGVYAIADKQDYYRASGKCDRPNLSISRSGSYWASYEDYTMGQLSVDFNISLSGSSIANNLQITSVNSSSGVSTATQLPLSLGEVTATKSAKATIKYNVPPNIGSFRTWLGATAQSPCGDTYSYPGSGGVAVPPAPAS